MVVTCPRCKIKLKVNETKLTPEGTKFKCPKCSAVLIVKKPVPQPERSLNSSTILIAHSKQALMQDMALLLSAAGYNVITVQDGIDFMIKSLKEFPFLGIIEVALPKIYGFEVCKRLKSRIETKDMKFILIPAIHDKTKYRREPTSLYGADDYIEESDISSQLIDKINRLRGIQEVEKTGEPEKPVKQNEPLSKSPVQQSPAGKPMTEMKIQKQELPAEKKDYAEKIEKAKRLARTIINDINLYNTAKVDAAIKSDGFYSVFSQDIKEGKKLYDNRISQEIRDLHDYYREAIDNFIAAKKAL